MDLGGLDLNTLTALVAMLQEGNLTKAGARVGMAQPTMSGVLSRYRRHFEDELLVRVGRDYQLTPLARELLPELQETLRLLRRTLRIDETFDPRTSSRIFTIGASDYTMTIVAPPLRRLIQDRAPHIRLEFADLADEPLDIPQVLSRYDIAIGPRGYAIGRESRLLFRDRLVCVVDRDNAFLRDGRLDRAALATMPHAETVFRNQPGTVVERALDEQGLSRNVALQAQGFLVLPYAVAGTDVVAIVPSRLARLFAGDGRLTVVELPFEAPELLESAWWHPSRVSDPGHRWLVGLLSELSEDLTTDEPGPRAHS